MLNVNLNDHFWISNLITGKTGTTSTLILTILNSNYVLYIRSNLINMLQNTNLTGNTLCNTYASYDEVIIRTNGTYCIFAYLQLPSNILLVNVNVNDHFWIFNISTGKTGTTSTLTLTILYYNYVLYIHSNLINVLQNYNLTGNNLCNTYALYDNAIVPTNGTHLLLSGNRWAVPR